MIAAARIASLGALLGLLCLWLLDGAQPREVPPLVRVGRPPPTRLVVLFVDSLSDRDVISEGAMPKLAARLGRGALHGPVQPCADAITVPCMTAAITGSDHLSVFALGTNFTSGSSAVERSVLGQLQQAGYRVGYLGERILAKTMAGLSYVRADLESDEQLLELLAPTLAEQRLDVLIAHFRNLDETAHKYGEAAPEYSAARARIDAQLETIMDELAPSDHVLVMGDHGHTTSGRHAAGLDATTYAAYLGPQFARKRETPMQMADHAAIWARLFGFSRSAPRWLDDYYAGRESRPRGAEGPAQAAAVPVWTLLSCLLLACATCMPAFDRPARERYRALASFAASLALMAGLGAVWPDLRAFVWDSLARIQIGRPASILVTGLLGGTLLGWLRPSMRPASNAWQARYAQTLTAAIVFALPTVYALGGATVVQSWLALGLFGYALWFAKKRDAGRAAQLALASLLVLSLVPVKHANYVLRGFTVYGRSLPSMSAYALPLVASALLLFTFISGGLLTRTQPPSWLAALIGASAAACAGVVSDQWFAVPCVLALPLVLLALRSARFTPLALACAIPAVWFFYGRSLTALTPILAVWSLCVLLPRALRASDPALRGVVFLSLVLMSFRTAMGCRIAGIDFDFFFRLLPHDADVTAHWMAAALFTTAKYVHTVTLSILLVKMQEPELARLLRDAAYIGSARLGMCLFFLVGLLVMQPGAGAAIVGDASQEAALWVIALLVLALASLCCAREDPRASTACQPSPQA
jgi:hypothetical protein